MRACLKPVGRGWCWLPAGHKGACRNTMVRFACVDPEGEWVAEQRRMGGGSPPLTGRGKLALVWIMVCCLFVAGLLLQWKGGL